MQKPCVSSRLQGVDLARGLAVLFMIWVHVLEEYASAGLQKSLFGWVIEELGGAPAAPVFMMLMGLSLAYSGKKTLGSGLVRGLKVFSWGYLLNIVRAVLPFWVAQRLMPGQFGGHVSPDVNALNLFLMIDILQFAGVALVTLALLRAMRPPQWLVGALVAVVSLVSPALWGRTTSLPGLNLLLDLLWGDKPSTGFVDNWVSFPLFPWLAFPLVGVVVGDLLRESKESSRVFRRAGSLGVALLAVGLALCATNPDYHFNDYYHSRQGSMIAMIGFVLAWLWGCHVVASRISNGRVFALLARWSKNVTNIYCIQWTLIVWGMAVWGIDHGWGATVALMLGTSVASDVLSRIYEKIKASAAWRRITNPAGVS